MLPYFGQGHPSALLQRLCRHAHHWGSSVVDPVSRPKVGHGVSSPFQLAKAQQEQEEEQQEHRCSQDEEGSRPRVGDLEHPREESVK